MFKCPEPFQHATCVNDSVTVLQRIDDATTCLV